MGEVMTRDNARQMFKDAGLTYAMNSAPNLCRLIDLIDQEMAASGAMMGTLRMRPDPDVKVRPAGTAYLRCRADYFEDREAVSFNADGFIGFAGWADDKNVQPILAGFAAWCQEMARPSPSPSGEVSNG